MLSAVKQNQSKKSKSNTSQPNKPKRKRSPKSLSASKNKLKLYRLELPLDDVSITQLSGELIATSWLKSVTIQGDGTTSMENSWTGLILDLMGMLFEKDPFKFMPNLTKNGVLSEGLGVSRERPRYAATSDIKFELYKLNGYSGYYVEFRRQYEEYVIAIKGLLKALNIPGSKIKFNVRPLEILSLDTNITKITDKSDLYTLANSNKKSEDFLEFKSISIMGASQSINSIHQALYIFLMWAIDVYGADTVMEAAIHQQFDEAGVTTAAFIEKYDTRFNTSKIGDNYLYTSGNVLAILKYWFNVAIQIGVSPTLIEITYDTLAFH